MERARYIGEAKSKETEWATKVAEYVQDEFGKHNQGFILIPWVNLDELNDCSEDDLKKILLGTCITDCTEPFMFAVAIAGAITSFAMTSKNENVDDKAAKALAKAISDIVDDVAKTRGHNGR